MGVKNLFSSLSQSTNQKSRLDIITSSAVYLEILTGGDVFLAFGMSGLLFFFSLLGFPPPEI